jgi:hypothetical protein
MFLETVSLVLKHSDIAPATNTYPSATNAGVWSNGKQKTTFNFNLRNMLGSEMYDNNELFVLRLNQLSYAPIDFPLAPQDQQVVVTLSGLNLLIQRIMLKQEILQDAYSGQTGYMNFNLCFKKEPNVKLNISFGSIDSDLDYAPSDVFLSTADIMHHFSIKFNITPFK